MSMIKAVEEARVFSIDFCDGKTRVHIREHCDEYYSIDMNKKEFGQFIKELADIHKSMGVISFDSTEEPPGVSKMKIRIAVAVNPAGDWSSAGWSGETDDCLRRMAADGVPGSYVSMSWVVAEVPVPDVVEVPGEVERPKPISEGGIL